MKPHADDEHGQTVTNLKWIPHGIRRWLTPPVVLPAIAMVFQAGIWWNQQSTKSEMRATRQDVHVTVKNDSEKEKIKQELTDYKVETDRRLDTIEKRLDFPTEVVIPNDPSKRLRKKP